MAAETELPEGALREALNVDLSDAGKPRRRAGYTKVYADTLCHSVFTVPGMTVFVANGVLKRLNPDYTVTELQAGLDPQRFVSYDFVDGVLYWMNGAQAGRVLPSGTAAPWWVPGPAGEPLVAASSVGGLDAGSYQVAVTFEDAGGRESGAGLATVVSVPAGGGISLASIPQGDADTVNVYLSAANGHTLYLHRALPMGLTSAHLGVGVRGRPLETQFLDPLPSGQILRHFYGRMLSAAGSTLFYSEAFRPGLCRLSRNYLQYPEPITVVQPVVDGVFVVADKTYFVQALGTPEQAQATVDDTGGVLGTGLRVDASYFNLQEVSGDIGCWFGAEGLVLGLPGGQVLRMTEGRLALDAYGRGASLARRKDGIQQVLTAVQGQASGFAAAELVVDEVRRNGITI